jgi:hypothetical protein
MRRPWTRRQVLEAGLVGLASAITPAQAGILDRLLGRKASKLVLIFVDVSASVRGDDWALYAATYREAIGRLRPGDRVVLGAISDVPMSRFVPQADWALPNTGVEWNNVERVIKTRRELLGQFDSLKGQRRGNRSRILDALNVAQQLIEADGERQARWIALCSDMLEHSNGLRFDTLRLDGQRIRGIIEQRRKANLLPSLQGAQVFVAGASGPTAQAYHEVRDFWMAYFAAAGAICQPGMYGRTAPRFPSEPWPGHVPQTSG